MHIGAWKNFIDLEDSLTLDELFELYGSIVEEESEKFRRDASLQGIDIPSSTSTDDGVEDDFRSRLAERLAEEEKKPIENTSFGEGQGYRVVGG